MAGIRIAKISYDHRPLEFTNKKSGLSIGEQIDSFIRETVNNDSLVSEVSVFFETIEEQHKLAEVYITSYAAKAM